MSDRRALLVCVGLLAPVAIAHAQPNTVMCASSGTQRTECPAETARGVTLVRTTGASPCIQGTSWGYDANQIWVTNGCAGEFMLGPATSPQNEDETKPVETWGTIEGGKGFLVGRTPYGELSISAYALIRYINQMPAGQTYVDHLGRQHPVDARHDIWAHRIMMHLKGWLGLPRLRYQITFWTVNTTDQNAIFAVLGYQFHRVFSLYGGLNGLPGSRTMLGSHPHWLANDRVMADEFFRPYFTHGVWATGEVVPGLWYTGMIGNNNSALGITSAQLTRFFAYSGSVWWMPTTHEFGPNGAFDDWEYHEELATRFGAAATLSHENEFTGQGSSTPENTTLRLADALNVFDTGSLAPDVTVKNVRFRLVTADAGLKYHGIFVGAQYFQRWLDDFDATGPLPVTQVVDRGFYVQSAFYPVKHILELYASTSWVFGDKDAGFPTQHEYIGGANWFFAKTTRDIRLNAQLIWVNRSPVSSAFGFYVGGQKGPTASLAASILF